MREVYIDKRVIDKRVQEEYGINNLILMENAGGNLARFIYKRQKKNTQVIFICGGGNNGADGLVAARILAAMNGANTESNSMKAYFNIKVIMLHKPKSELCKMHFDIIQKLNITVIKEYKREVQEDKAYDCKDESLLKILNDLETRDIVVDCIFGSGFDSKKAAAFYAANAKLYTHFQNCKALKIACDVPSGLSNVLDNDYKIQYILGAMHYTIAMAAYNLSLLDSRVKDIVGKIKIAHIGLESNKYNLSHFKCDSLFSNIYLLTKKDIKLPFRFYQNNNKGDFGTVYIFAGEMFGASLISARAALNFGAGKVCIYEGLLRQKHKNKDCQIIYIDTIAYANRDGEKRSDFAGNVSIAIGMGLSYNETQYSKVFSFLENVAKDYLAFDSVLNAYSKSCKSHLRSSMPKFIFDADILYRKELAAMLPKLKESIVTPHPKEFLALLQNLDSKNAPKDMHTLLANLSQITLDISEKYKDTIFLIKGANTIIAYRGIMYINNLGKSNLAKGGSGDVLSGLIASLLAQGYSSLESCIQASLAHAIASEKALKRYSSYALTPNKLIKIIGRL